MHNKFDYILALFKTVYSIDFSLDIGYGEESSAKISIRQGAIEFFEKEEAIPEGIVWKRWSDKDIPFLFDGSDAAELISSNGGSYVVNYDIIAASFYFLSGWQEHFIEERDEWGRFSFDSSIQAQLGIVNLPVVNYYFDILKHAVEEAYGVKLTVNMWGDCEYATFLSHDIDRCQSGWLEGSSAEVKKGNLLSPLKLIAKKIMVEDVWFNFDELLDLEKGFDARSTFFFLAKEGKVNGIPNADYDVSDVKFEAVFKNIEDGNSEIGIHGSLGTSKDSGQLVQEIGEVGVKISGNRLHTLAYDAVTTPAVLEAANLSYDSTLGFAESIGFRNSFCFPFFLYNIAADEPYKVLEIPLMIMDTTLQHQKYMGIPSEEVVSAIQPLFSEV